MRHDAQRLQWLFYTNEIVLFSFLFWFPLEKLLPFSLGSDRCNPSVKLSAIIKIQKNGIPDARFSGDDWQHQITIVHNFRCGYISETHMTFSTRRVFAVSFSLCLTTGWITIFHRSEKQLKRKIKNHGSLSFHRSKDSLTNSTAKRIVEWFLSTEWRVVVVFQPNKKKR